MRRVSLLILSLFCMIGSLLAQNQVVSGIVYSSVDKEPIIGASVVLKDKPTVGASTNLDGKFSFSAPASSKIIKISYLGMQTKEVKITPNMKIYLDPDSKALDEVVVVGMTRMDKRLFTGATTKVDGDKAKLDGVPDAARALEGKAAGVSVQNVSATFGSAPKIRIRGATSIYGSSKPLWVVDGVVMDDVVNVGPDDLASGDATTLISNAIAGLNSDDIASFQVLKDGSATSIYGARAMAGVIVVTTKKGRSGFSKISYTGEYTYRMIPQYGDFNIMNSQEQMSVYKELEQKGFLGLARVANQSNSGIYGKMYDLINQGKLLNTDADRNAYLREGEFRNTNWFNELFNHTLLNTHSVSITAGTDKASYYASMSAMVDPGWTKQSNVRRYTANLNTTYKILPDLSLNMIATASVRDQRAPGTLTGSVDAVTGNISRDFDINPFSYAMTTSRVLDPNEFYRYNYTPFNIKHELDNNYMNINVFDLKYQAELRYKVNSDLEFAVLGDIKYNKSKNEYIVTENSNRANAYRAMQTATIIKSNPFLYKNPDKALELPVTILPQGGFYDVVDYGLKAWDFRATGQYHKQLEHHVMNLFGGMEINSIDRERSAFDGYGMQYTQGETVFFDPLVFKKLKEDGGGYYGLSHTFYRNAAFFANATYSYKSRYTINGTIRYEGTNKMGKSRSARWLPTWNTSASWNVGNESFFSALRPYMSNLVLKGSYSLTADKGPDWVNNSTIIIKSTTPWRQPASMQESAYYVSSPENSTLTYEKKHEMNFGFDAGFANDRINLSFDIYKRNNYDLISLMVTQGLAGSTLQFGNAASMESNGIELSLSTTNIKTKDFSWTTDFIYAHAENKITEFHSNSRLIDMVQGRGFAKEGYPVRSVFSIPFAGLSEDGFPSFYVNPERTQKTITEGIYFQERDQDKLAYLTYSGNADPTDFGSLGNTFKYKGLELNVFLTYSFGNVVRLYPSFSSYYSDLSAMPREFADRWIKAGDEEKTNVPVIVSTRQNYEVANIAQAYSSYNYTDERIAKGDFIRLKEISLSYSLPSKWLKPLKISDMSIKLQATNLMLLYSDSKLKGADPEFSNAGGVAMPLPRQFTATLRIGI